jgi:uncharacterized protein (DUF983 family)
MRAQSNMPFIRHSCPNCGWKVPPARRWFRPWIWARWRCESCGTPLRFDLGRRLLAVLLVIPAFPIVGGLADFVEQSWGLVAEIAVVITMAMMCGGLVALVDAVTYDHRSLDTATHGDT